MEDKYYTQEIEEFRFGFEFEYCMYPESTDEFNKDITNWVMLDILQDDYEHQPKELFKRTYRVKYLDKSDIEECGFMLEASLDTEYIFRHKLGFTLHKPKSNSDLIAIILSHIVGVHNIIIKNKSELKMILKMLNIK